MKGNPLFQFAVAGYQWIITGTSWLQPLFLLIIRLYWGWQFHITGMAKLNDIPKFAKLFQGWGIPFPELNVHIAGYTECYAGLLLLLGFASRIITVPLIFTMIIAYLTASHDVVINIFNKPDDFVSADPFLFMLAAVIVFLFGPGPLSLDGLIGLFLKRRVVRETSSSGAPS